MARIDVKGIIGKDPEIKFFNDFSVTSFPVAYTPREKKANEWVDGETVWFRVSISGKQAEAAVDQYKKGDRVVVIGTLKVSNYNDREGNPKVGLEIRAESVGVIPKMETKKQARPSQEEDLSWN
jgi:single-strand DNA-binding protein